MIAYANATLLIGVNFVSFINYGAMNREGVKWKGFQRDEQRKREVVYENKLYSEDAPEGWLLNIMLQC